MEREHGLKLPMYNLTTSWLSQKFTLPVFLSGARLSQSSGVVFAGHLPIAAKHE